MSTATSLAPALYFMIMTIMTIMAITTVNPLFSLQAAPIITVKCEGTEEECLKQNENGSTFSQKHETDRNHIRVGNVPKEATKSMQDRVEAKNLAYFGFGPGLMRNAGTESAIGYSFLLGHSWEATPHGSVKMEATVQGAPDKGAYWLSAVLGGNFFFTDGDFSPFITADLGLGVTRSDSLRAIGGFVAGVGTGIQLFRTSSVHMQLLAKYDHLFHKGSTNGNNPGRYGLSLALYF